MRYIFGLLIAVTMFGCSSSQGMQQDVSEATITESKSDVSGCVYIGKVSASVDLPEYGSDQAAAMDQLLDNLRNAALHTRCDTVYLFKVEEITNQIIAMGKGTPAVRGESVTGPVEAHRLLTNTNDPEVNSHRRCTRTPPLVNVAAAVAVADLRPRPWPSALSLTLQTHPSNSRTHAILDEPILLSGIPSIRER